MARYHSLCPLAGSVAGAAVNFDKREKSAVRDTIAVRRTMPLKRSGVKPSINVRVCGLELIGR